MKICKTDYDVITCFIKGSIEGMILRKFCLKNKFRCNAINLYRGVFRTKSNIYDGAFFVKIVNGFWMFNWVLNVTPKYLLGDALVMLEWL